MKLFTAWMEVLANVGVLVGIIFLTIEVSQNTLSPKISVGMRWIRAEGVHRAVSK